MARFTVKRFIAIIVICVLAWNIITAFDEALDNLYFRLTRADKNDPNHWFIIGLIGVIVLGAMLHFINMDMADVLGVNVRSNLRVKF